MGCSRVRMWRASERLSSWTRAATVLDLPEQVGPATSTRPCLRWARAARSGVQVEAVQGGLEGREQANGEADAPGAVQNIEAAAHAPEVAGEVGAAPVLQLGPQGAGQQAAGLLEEDPGGHGLAEGAELTAHAHGGG